MTVFVIGDRVRVRSHPDIEGTVADIKPGSFFPIQVNHDWDDVPAWYSKGDLELVLELVEDATDPTEETQQDESPLAEWEEEFLLAQEEWHRTQPKPVFRSREGFSDSVKAALVEPSLRVQVLDEAKALIVGDRNNAYGEPGADFSRTAAIWQALGYRGPDGRDLKGSDVALLMIGLKMSRATWMHKRDNFVDMAGYAACGFEVSESE